MSSVENVTPTALVRTLFERLNDRDADSLISQFAADDIVEEWPVAGHLEGKQAVLGYFAAMFASIPDLRIELERMAADGETVFVHWHMTGTFSGASFQGLEATGRSIDIRGNDCFTIRDGKVAANFIAYDGMTFAVQAGILPPPGSRMDRVVTFATNLMTSARKRLGRSDTSERHV
ncbi:MAG: ester cyclase [Solirubrobacteraceae bacterium]